MKPRASLEIFTSQTLLIDLKPSRSRTELNTPDFAQVDSPNFPSPSSEIFNPFERCTSRTTFLTSSSSKPILSRQVKEKRTSGNFFSEDSSFSQITGKTGTESLEMLLMARESLKVVRKEARNVFHSSRKALKDSQKSRRSSLPEGDLKGVLSFCCNEENPIRDLAENINAIKNRVLLNEVNNQKQIKEQIWLKETLRRMEKRMERREREKKNGCHGCVGFCTVI